MQREKVLVQESIYMCAFKPLDQQSTWRMFILADEMPSNNKYINIYGFLCVERWREEHHLESIF